MRVKVTSPSGLWDYQSFLGASVRIKSLSVKAGFAYDGNSIYSIKDIGFRISSIGKSYSVISLEGLPGKEFVWKDLEILSLRFPMWKPAICGMFCAGEAICGYSATKTISSTSTTTTTSEYDYRGDIIDGGNL